MPNNVVVWIDHKEAHVIPIHQGEAGTMMVAEALHRIHNKHPRGAAEPKTHPADAKHFFHDVSQALNGADAILIVGPSTAKLELVRYLHLHEHALEVKVVGVETADHPTEGQLAAHAKQYFGHHA